MVSVSTLFAGTAIVTGAAWLGRYARSIRKGYGHDPQAKSVWWTTGGGVVSNAVSNKETVSTK